MRRRAELRDADRPTPQLVERADTRLAMPMQVLRIEENGNGRVSTAAVRGAAAAAAVTGSPVQPGVADR